MPTNIAVTIFKPIWKFHTAPIKFIININSPPKTEFIINLNNAFNGTENIFPIIHKTIIHPKITKALEKSNFITIPLVICMIKIGQILPTLPDFFEIYFFYHV